MPKLDKVQPMILGLGLECGLYPSSIAWTVYDKPSDVARCAGMCMVLASVTTIMCPLCIWLARMYFHYIPNRKSPTTSFD